MKQLFLLSIALLLISGVYSYSSSTVPIQGEVKQQQVCNGIDVGEIDYNTTVKNRTVNFEGVFCAPNIGYTLEESNITVEQDTVKAYARISAPDGVTGPAVTPVRFKESRQLSPGTYLLETRIEVESYHNISETTDIKISGEKRSFIARIKAFFAGFLG